MGEASPGIRVVAIAVTLFLFTLLFYARTTQFEFVSFDDQVVLLGHPQLYNETDFPESLRQIFIEYFPREEPLPIRDLTWAIDARVWGFENPFGYHLGNVVLNALVVVLLFVFLQRTLGRTLLAAGIALAFALLPIHAEPVAWVMGRKDLLVALFMLAALVAQSLGLHALQRSHRLTAYGASLALTGLALGSKISAVSLFLVLYLHRVFQPHLEGRVDADPEPPLVSQALRALPPILPHAALTVATFLWYRGVLNEWGVLETNAPAPLSAEHLGNVFSFFPLILGEYVLNVLNGMDLTMYDRWPHVAIPLTPLERVGSAAIAACGLAGVITVLWKRRDLAFFALLPLALLVPYTGLFYVGFWQADRYVYLASAGVLTVIALLGHQWITARPAWRTPVLAAGLLFLLTSALLSWQQQSVWRNSESLWQYEAGREAPSLLSIQALAKMQVQAGERAKTPEARAAAAKEAYVTVDRGFRRLEELRLEDSNYWLPETAQTARLHLLKGRIAALLGVPFAKRVPHFKRAFEMAPDRLNAILLSQSLFQQSGTALGADRERLVRESLEVFEIYVQLSGRDAHQLAESRALLERNYAGRFPNLEPQIAAIRKAYYP